MTTYRIAVIPGDGIGKEVVPEGLRVLEAAGRKFGIAFKWSEYPWSCEWRLKHGRMMPEDALETLAPPAQPPVRWGDQVGDHLQERRLPAARRSEQRDELPGPDGEVDRVERPGAVGVDLVGRQHLDDRRRVGGHGHGGQDAPSRRVTA